MSNDRNDRSEDRSDRRQGREGDRGSRGKPDDKQRRAAPAPKTVGETAVRKPHEERMATESGGTSGAEDTTRLAGYVADISKANEPQPGPPVRKDPALTTTPENTPPPPPDPKLPQKA